MDEKVAPVPVLDGEEDINAPSITNFDDTRERWNGTRINTYRFFVTCWSFIIMGMNDAAVGVSLSIFAILQTYQVLTTVLSTGPHSLCKFTENFNFH